MNVSIVVGGNLLTTNMSAANGSTVAYFVTQMWEISTLNRVAVIGPGSNVQCDGYRVDSVSTGFVPTYSGLVTLLPAGSTSDANVPSNLSLNGLQSVSWNASYWGGPLSQVGATCNATWNPPLVVSSQVDFFVRFQLSGTNITAEIVQEVATQAHFSVPTNFGSWNFQNLTASMGTIGMGLSFKFTGPCVVA